MTCITDPAAFGRVAVVMGGDSSEREVSLNSGGNVLAALRARGVDATAVDGIPALIAWIREGRCDRVFNILHGRGGEDGVLQGALEALGVAYTGSGVLGSALTMDKVRTKRVWQALAIPTPAFAVLAAGADVAQALQQVGLPAIVKPSREGSSVGVTRVFRAQDVAAAVELAARYDGELLVERLIEGPELTVGVLAGQALPSIRIVPAGEFYDYHSKYISDDTRYLCPGLAEPVEGSLKALCERAFAAVGCSGWGRIDVMQDAGGGFHLLEVNTTPGMTSHSLVPKAAAQLGIDFEELCWRILETSLRGGGR
ncbi:MAG: D-alanine--D-alanine ligase [Xanthomonadales bacterium PRO6]|nr:D-alanine--D-alanine ligase [Xanthomonadales bacterium]MCE7932575.1 D-alanine--D-alanine ligase [Xanthomonadales bacterium PRO6]